MTYNGTTYDDDTALNDQEQALLDQVRNDQPTTDQPDPRQSILSRQERLKAIAEQSGIPLLGGGDIGLSGSSIGPGQSSEELQRASYPDTPQNQTLSSADLPPGAAITTGPSGFATTGAVPESMTYGLGKLGLDNKGSVPAPVSTVNPTQEDAMLKAATDAANGNADAAAYLRYAETNDIQRQVAAGTQPTQAIASSRWARPDVPKLDDIKLQYDISGNTMLSPEMRGAAVAKAKAMEGMQARDMEYRMNLFKNIPKPAETQFHSVPGVGGGSFNPNTGEWKNLAPAPEKPAATEKMSAIDLEELKGAMRDIGEVNKKRTDPDLAPDTLKALNKMESAARTKIDGLKAKYSKTGTSDADTTQKVTTKAQFDALPKGAVYIGKDGKRYRKP